MTLRERLRRLARSLRRRASRLLRSLGVQTFSSLTRRIVILNLAGLVALVVASSTSTSSAKG